MAWQTPKTDWTANDYFSFGDLDRIESNTAHLATLLAILEILVVITTVTGRTISRIEFADDLNRIEANINAIATLFKPPGWEAPKTNWLYGDGPNFQDINRMERNMSIQQKLIQGNIDHIPYSGTFYSGEARP